MPQRTPSVMAYLFKRASIQKILPLSKIERSLIALQEANLAFDEVKTDLTFFYDEKLISS